MDKELLHSTLTYVDGKFFRKGKIAGSVHQNGYMYIGLNRKIYSYHRLVWFYHYNEWPKGDLDHINCDKLDNRIENLREVNDSQNKLNTHKAYKNNSLGVLGVQRKGSKYRARLRVNNKLIIIGLYDTVEQASHAYHEAKKAYS